MENLPWEIVLFLIAAIIAAIQKFYEWSREFRRRSTERERREGGVDTEEPPTAARPQAPVPRLPERRTPPPGPLIPPPPPRSRRPAPAPVPVEPPPPPPPRARRPAPRSRPAPAPRPPPAVSKAPALTELRAEHHLRRQVRELLTEKSIRDAVIVREVLGPPRALRRAPWIR